MKTFLLSLALCAGLALAPSVASAQPADTTGAAIRAALWISGTLPSGDFAEYVDQGGGLGGAVLLPVRGPRAFTFRIEGGYTLYGSEAREVCFSNPVGCRVRLDLTTDHQMAWLHLGPEVAASTGAVRPYVNLTFGGTYLYTSSSVRGTADWNAGATSVNFDDFTWSWGLGAGATVPLLTAGSRPVRLDAGVRYLRNGTADYVREGGLTDLPDGSTSVNPTRSGTDLVAIHLGVSVTLHRFAR